MRFLVISLLVYVNVMASMSIDEAWKSVTLKNDGIKAEQTGVTRAELKQKSAKSMYLPSVSVSGSYTHLSEPVNIDISGFSTSANNILASLGATSRIPSEIDLSKQDVFLADLHLLWPLYTGGKIDAAQDIFKAQVSEAKAKIAMKKDLAFLKLIKYYYGVVVSKSLFLTREEAQKALSLHYENAKKLKKQGQIAKIELLNARVKLDAAIIETSKSKHKYEIALSALHSITKSSDKPSSNLFVNASMKDEDYYKNQTRENYAPLKILDAKDTQSKALVSMKEADWFPKVAAVGNYNLYKDDSPIMKTLPTWFAGVVVKIDLLKRKDRSQEVEMAELLNAKVKHLKLQALQDLSLLVEKTYKEMISDYEEFNSLSSSMALARENYRLRNIAFREGLSTSVELVDAQMFLLGAKTKRLNAAYEFVKKVSQLSVLSGNREMFFEVEKLSQEIK